MGGLDQVDRWEFDDRLPLVFLNYKTGAPDPRFDGLEVYVRSLDIRTWARYDELTGGGLLFNAANVERIEGLCEIIAGALVEWNLAEDGEVLPCTVESLMSRHKLVLRALVDAFTEAQIGLTLDFGDSSTDGGPTVEDLPMGPASLAS